MTNAGVISAQHPKNVGVVNQTMEGRPNLLEEARRMA
jgi:hypothetical protein